MTKEQYCAMKSIVHILRNSEQAKNNTKMFDIETGLYLETQEILDIAEKYFLELLENEGVKE